MIQSVKNLWRRIPHYMRYAMGIFAVSRILLVVIGSLTEIFIKQPINDTHVGFLRNIPFLGMWNHWDSFWYITIAQYGYHDIHAFNPMQFSPTGFFPLYPMLLRAAHYVTQNYDLAGIIVSNVFLFMAVHYLYKLIRLDFDEKTSLRTVLFLFVFPAAFYLSAIFAESLFLALSLGSIYKARQGKWLWACVFAGLLVLTKAFGVLILIPLVFLYLKEKDFKIRNIKADILYFLSVPLALAGFCFYLYKITGDALAYFHVQSGAWKHTFGHPLEIFMKSFTRDDPHDFMNAVFLIIVLIFLLALFKNKRMPKMYLVYGICLLLFVPFTGAVVGTLRYASFNFPIFLGLALSTEKDTPRDFTIMGLSLLQATFMILWAMGTIWAMA